MSHQQHLKKQRIKAIILSGGCDFGRCQVASRLSTALWPVMYKPVFAFVMDHLDEVRKNCITIDTDTNNQLRDAEIAKLTIQMDGCVATDPFEKVAETGRFVLMRDNDIVAGGVLREETKAVR